MAAAPTVLIQSDAHQLVSVHKFSEDEQHGVIEYRFTVVVL
jgi:hypothetical protein